MLLYDGRKTAVFSSTSLTKILAGFPSLSVKERFYFYVIMNRFFEKQLNPPKDQFIMTYLSGLYALFHLPVYVLKMSS